MINLKQRKKWHEFEILNHPENIKIRLQLQLFGMSIEGVICDWDLKYPCNHNYTSLFLKMYGNCMCKVIDHRDGKEKEIPLRVQIEKITKNAIMFDRGSEE